MPQPLYEASGSPTGSSVRTDATAFGGGEISPRAADEPFVLRGTFVVVDERGVEHAREDGTFRIWLGGAGKIVWGRELTLQAGAWELSTMMLPERVSVDDVMLGARPVICDAEMEIDPSIPLLQFRGRWLAPVTLRVLGSDTGSDLANVRVLLGDGYGWHGGQHPGHEGGTTVVVDHTPSPVRFSPTPGRTRTFLVGAPGYAWGSIDLDPAESAERLLRLEPGGGIDLTLVGSLPYDTVVRLRKYVRGRPLADWRPSDEGVTRIDGVPAGTWNIQVEKGLWFQDPLVLGRTTAQVVPHTVAAATIALRTDQRSPPFASAAGTVVIPSAWRRQRVRLEIDPTGETRPWGNRQWLDVERIVPATSDEYRWTAGRIRGGTYQVCVRGCGFVTRFEVPPLGDQNIRIVVPEPSEVRLRVLDAETGKPIEMAAREPEWQPLHPWWDAGSWDQDMARQPDGSYLAQTPPGPMRIDVITDRYARSSTRHEVVPGTNEFVVQVAPVCGVEIELWDGPATVPWPNEGKATLQDATGGQRNAYRSGNRTAAKVPGEFTLTIADVPGFEPIPPRAVTVSPRTWTKVEVRLRRKP